MNPSSPVKKQVWRTALASAMAALWLTACGGGSTTVPEALSLATSSSSVQAAAGQAPAAAPAQGAVQGPAAASSDSAEFRVNTTTEGRQENSSIARLKNGGHVVAWMSGLSAPDGASPPTQSVCTQRYGMDGTALGQETCMAPDAVLLSKPALASLDDGGYLLVWQVRQGVGGSDHNLFAQRFDASGAPVRAVQQINSTTLSSYLFSSISAAGLADGGYVVTWTAPRSADTGPNIYARRFGADGIACPCGPEKRVNALAGPDNLDIRTNPSVAGLADGGYLVAWSTGMAIHAQRYGANNLPMGPATPLTPDTSGDLLGANYPAVAGLAGGGHVVASLVARNATGQAVELQSFRADGTALAAPSVVNPVLAPLPTCTRLGAVVPCPRPVEYPAVAALDDGGFVVAWSEGVGPAVTGSHARRYGADGAPLGAPQQVASGVQAAVGATSLGGFLISVQRSDGSGDGIFARYLGAQSLRGSAAP